MTDSQKVEVQPPQQQPLVLQTTLNVRRQPASLVVVIDGVEKKMCKHCIRMLDHSEYAIKKNGKVNVICKACISKVLKTVKKVEVKKQRVLCECGSKYYESCKEKHYNTAYHNMRMYKIEKARLKEEQA